ncbi:MAG: hypothetical protein D8B60_09760 [Moraxella sp.]|nr:MAG: hypothetical protein D8B60_09760 [Moraxella sp.]
MEQEQFLKNFRAYVNMNYRNLAEAAKGLDTSESYLYGLLSGKKPFTHLYKFRLQQLGVQIEGLDELITPIDVRQKRKGKVKTMALDSEQYNLMKILKILRIGDERQYNRTMQRFSKSVMEKLNGIAKKAK